MQSAFCVGTGRVVGEGGGRGEGLNLGLFLWVNSGYILGVLG